MLDNQNDVCSFVARPTQMAEVARHIELVAEVLSRSSGRLAAQVASTALCSADPQLDVVGFRGRTAVALSGVSHCCQRLRSAAAMVGQSKRRAEEADTGEWKLSVGQTLSWWAAYRVAHSAQRASRGAVSLVRLFGVPDSGTYSDRGRQGDTGGAFTTRVVDRWKPSTGREVTAQALALTGDGHALGPDEFAVVVHQPNVLYSVVLPGVTDLTRPTAGLDPHHRSVRDLDMAAVPSAAVDGAVDPYASMVATALERLEIPPGAGLNLVGHSYGAAAVMTLAADPSFNRRFNVRSVVAAGYYIKDDRPAVTDTAVIALENHNDLVVTGERFVFAPVTGRSDTRSRVLQFNGGLGGVGHAPANYSSFASRSDAEPLNALDRRLEGDGFNQGGQVLAVDVSVPVDDPTWLASNVGRPSRPSAWRWSE